MGKLSLSDKRIAEILDEVAEEMRLAEDVAMRERQSGLRCTCCNARLAAPTASGECADCAVL